MRDISKINIWKEEIVSPKKSAAFLNADISELMLSVRSYNCLKRAGCHTISDVMELCDEDEVCLKKIRNLGAKSEAEILEKLKEYESECEKHTPIATKTKGIIITKPAKSLWNTYVADYSLSSYTKKHFKDRGIEKVKDLYKTDWQNEPSWYAVRELFEKMPTAKYY